LRDFRKLKVWQKAHLLTLRVYQATRTFPRDELFGLTSQARRASQSIAANIAEGCGREGPAELTRYLRIASGSASELEYHLLLAKDLRLLDEKTYSPLAEGVIEIKRMLTVLVQKLTAES
jgi:four helix bundle protein